MTLTVWEQVADIHFTSLYYLWCHHVWIYFFVSQIAVCWFCWLWLVTLFFFYNLISLVFSTPSLYCLLNCACVVVLEGKGWMLLTWLRCVLFAWRSPRFRALRSLFGGSRSMDCNKVSGVYELLLRKFSETGSPGLSSHLLWSPSLYLLVFHVICLSFLLLFVFNFCFKMLTILLLVLSIGFYLISSHFPL